jgi:hypothetical protein
MFSYVTLEDRVPADHPLREIRKTVDEILRGMAKEFDSMYAKTGRPSVPPERLLRAVLLQIFYTVRSEWMLMEQLTYNLLFRTQDFVQTARALNTRPHVAQNVNRPGGSAIDKRTARHASYHLSQRKRPLIEKAFGWMKQTGGMRKTKLRGLAKVAWQFVMTSAAFNLLRLPKLHQAVV